MSENVPTVRAAPEDGAVTQAAASAKKPAPRPVPPRLGPRGWLRWVWRQLTSMRTALMLLLLLAVAAVPGSVLPQRPQDEGAVWQFMREHPGLGRALDRVGMFDVYASVWFSAVYLLLFVSLIGCIVPRAIAHTRQLRAAPPRVPNRFDRFGVHTRIEVDTTPDQVVAAATAHLRRGVVGGTTWGRWLPTYRVVGGSGSWQGHEARTVSAERGYLRESGNVLFHVALVGVLVAVGVGQQLHYRGQAIVTEGRGFVNAMVDYDTFTSGAWFSPSSLVPFTVTLDRFDAAFTTDAKAFAQPRDFTAHVTVRDPGGDSEPRTIKVNHPLIHDGSKIYLQGNGYAPNVTIRDQEGNIAFAGPVPFLPQDAVYTSRGVIKVPDVTPGLDQIGLIGYLLPTADITGNGARSVYPQPLDPVLVLEVYTGDLGLDDGLPQNVYQLDTAAMTAARDSAGDRAQVLIRPGETADLPGGAGTITFTDLPRYVALDLRHDPSLGWVLGFALAALAGLGLSLFIPRRRIWVRTYRDAGQEQTVVLVAGLSRGEDAGLPRDVQRLVAALGPRGRRDMGVDTIADGMPAD